MLHTDKGGLQVLARSLPAARFAGVEASSSQAMRLPSSQALRTATALLHASQTCGAWHLHLPPSIAAKNGFAGSWLFSEKMGHEPGMLGAQ